jgi:hypothetical protein
MKPFFIFAVSTMFFSCVSTKKYRMLESSLNNSQIELQFSKDQAMDCSINNKNLERKIVSLENDNTIIDIKLTSKITENKEKDERLKALDSHLSSVKSSNDELLKRIEGLSSSNIVNVGIMKKLLEDQEIQQLKVLNLSLALQKQDSLNIHLVKKSKTIISDDKLKKTLEKLGFVFF